jgi:TolC family type I secretion outer membrane protein
LAQTYQNNSTILSARQGFKAAQEDIVQAKSARKPSVNAEADITYVNTDASGNEFQVSNGGNLSKSVGLSVNQPLYTGGSVSAGIDQAEYLVGAQGFALSAVEQQMLFEAVEAYMDVFTNQAVLELQRNNQAVVVRELEQARARFDVGEITRTDVSQSEARYAGAQADVINAGASVRTAKSNFKQIVGAEPPSDMSYPEIIFNMPADLGSALEWGLSNNREILQANLNKEAAQSAVEGIEGERRPQVYAQGGLSQSLTPNDFIDDQRRASIGVVASMPLYTGGATRSRIRQAAQIVHQHEQDILTVKQRIENEIVAYWENWQAAKAETTAREAQVSATRLAQEGVDAEAEYGERTTLDALNADQELLSAQVDLTISKRNEIVSRFALARVLGLLVSQNLGFSTINP